MTDSNSNLVIDMEYGDHEGFGGTPPSPLVDTVKPDLTGAAPIVPPAASTQTPPAVPPAPDPAPAPVAFDGTPIAAFSMALKVLEPFSDLDVDKAAKVEDILPKIEDQWNKALQTQEAKILKKFEDIAGEIALYQTGRPDAIAELYPLKQIALLPIEATQDISEDIAANNRKELIISMYTQLRNNTIQEAEALYEIVKGKGEDKELALKAAKDFGTMYVQSIQQIQQSEEARKAADKKSFDDAQEKINTSIKKHLSEKRLLGLDITDTDVNDLTEAIYGEATSVYKILDDKGQEIEKKGTKAEMFFDLFDQNPEFQLMVLHRYLKGDFNRTSVKDKRTHILQSQVAEVLNAAVIDKASNSVFIDNS